MSKIWLPGGGGGADLDVVTAGAGDVLAGKVIVGPDGEPLTGTLALTGTAADSQVLAGQTYYNTDAKTERMGTMVNRGAWTGSAAMNGSVTIPAGYHNGSGKVNGPAITNRGNYGGTGNSRGNDTANSRIWVKLPGGYYNENAQVYLTWADIRSMTGLTADKLKKNVSIMGLIGSFEGYVSSPLYLYNAGTWSNLPTTGTTTMAGIGGTMTITPYRTVNGSTVTYTDAIIRTNSVLDLTAYKYLKIAYTGSEYDADALTMYLGVSAAPNVASLSFTKVGTLAAASGTCICDVSSLSGNYYIYIGGRSQYVYSYRKTVTINSLVATAA